MLAEYETKLTALLLAQPDATFVEIRAALPTTAGLSTLWRSLRRLGFTVKKGKRRRTVPT